MAFETLPSAPAGLSSPGTARSRLRQATAADHAAVDKAYSAFDLSKASDYRTFLDAQYGCLSPLEDALTAGGAAEVIADWPSRRRAALIRADLDDLNAPARAERSAPLTPALHGAGAVLGSLYVLEGSRFGGSVLARRVAAGLPTRFLSAGSAPEAWRSLMLAMDRHLASEKAFADAVAAARAVFAIFEAAVLPAGVKA